MLYKKYSVLNDFLKKRFFKIIIVIWMIIKVVFLIGIVTIFSCKNTIQKEKIFQSGNIKFFQDVSGEMTTPQYWIDKDRQADKSLMSAKEIDVLNASILASKNTHMFDLQNCENVIDGVSLGKALRDSVMDNLKFLTACFNSNGKKINSDFVAKLAFEASNPQAKNSQNVEYLICTTQTDLLSFPTTQPILKNKNNFDEDKNHLSAIRLGEPMVALSQSASENYFYVHTSNCSGWVKAEDVALCENKSEWMKLWNIEGENSLVVTGDSIFLEHTNMDDTVSNKEMSMGVVLRLVDKNDIPDTVNNRATFYNYVVYLPVRTDEGKCEVRMALIPQNANVSVGFLELTKENIIRQSFCFLGNVYGWGGMLHSRDCSGMVRDIFKCFNIELPRNSSWQQAVPVKKYDTYNMKLSQKIKLLHKIPIGSILFMDGHVMLYIGENGGQFYCISATGSVRSDAKNDIIKLRCVSINPLEKTYRPDKTSWLEDISAILVLWE